MIIDRIHFNVARGFGNVSKAAELMSTELKRMGLKGRVLTPKVAPYNTLAVELEYESLAERERIWDEYMGSQEWRSFFTEFNEVIEAGGTHEIWDVRATL